jgi:hypothetical protein
MLKTMMLMLCAAVSMLAAGENDWGNLQSLKPGDRVGVIQTNQKRVEGRFQSFSDSGITLQDGVATIAKADVVRVYHRPRTRRLVRTVIGAGIGTVAGIITYETAGDRFRNEGTLTAADGFAWIGGGAGLGAGIGAATGGGYRTVYRSK